MKYYHGMVAVAWASSVLSAILTIGLVITSYDDLGYLVILPAVALGLVLESAKYLFVFCATQMQNRKLAVAMWATSATIIMTSCMATVGYLSSINNKKQEIEEIKHYEAIKKNETVHMIDSQLQSISEQKELLKNQADLLYMSSQADLDNGYRSRGLATLQRANDLQHQYDSIVADEKKIMREKVTHLEDVQQALLPLVTKPIQVASPVLLAVLLEAVSVISVIASGVMKRKKQPASNTQCKRVVVTASRTKKEAKRDDVVWSPPSTPAGIADDDHPHPEVASLAKITVKSVRQHLGCSQARALKIARECKEWQSKTHDNTSITTTD